jgi:hypothetical protein
LEEGSCYPGAGRKDRILRRGLIKEGE